MPRIVTAYLGQVNKDSAVCISTIEEEVVYQKHVAELRAEKNGGIVSHRWIYENIYGAIDGISRFSVKGDQEVPVLIGEINAGVQITDWYRKNITERYKQPVKIITITDELETRVVGDHYYVPMKDVLGAMVLLHQTKSLDINSKIEIDAFLKDLPSFFSENFRRDPDKYANYLNRADFPAIMSLGLTCWYAQQLPSN